ncbi:YceD family protein [Acidithiobacillus sp. M4-SHS-6]|uniref:YceD family protein n=1 Tax=Acidithiobacillus sp. M4-SHS-6 TaxID=3383024 RepID=UPI0039BE7C83
MFSAKTHSLYIAKVAELGDTLAGSVDLALWARLAAALKQLDVVQVQVVLRRTGSVVLAEGMIEVEGQIRCERCLGNMPLVLQVPVHSALAESEAAVGALDPDLDVVLAEKGAVALQTWLEDEVLLALPMVPRCAEWQTGICPVSGREVFVTVD